ncbi:MAG TPA: hypothetical protein VK989_07770 [Polyangia bacterium]|jgi:hypothetical protein|nr:hypothetical protein [Polyangia bacterium]
MRRALWLVPVAIFFLNPGFACGPPEPQYQYGAAEMRAAVEGSWSFTLTPITAGASKTVTLRIAQSTTAPAQEARAPGRAFVRAAYACGNRTLVASASACVDSSSMPLAITFVSGDASLTNGPFSGMFIIESTTFVDGRLDLTVGSYQLSMQVRADGTIEQASVPSGDWTVTVQRS